VEESGAPEGTSNIKSPPLEERPDEVGDTKANLAAQPESQMPSNEAKAQDNSAEEGPKRHSTIELPRPPERSAAAEGQPSIGEPAADTESAAAVEVTARDEPGDREPIQFAKAATATLPSCDPDAVQPRDLIGIEDVTEAFSYLIAARAMQPPLAIGLSVNGDRVKHSCCAPFNGGSIRLLRVYDSLTESYPR
jgi:hypothetical protein